METLISTVGRAVNGGSVLYIILEIVIFLIGIWILYAVIKSAVKNALFASRKELDISSAQRFCIRNPIWIRESKRSRITGSTNSKTR
ncbi:MAG: hypothetical protein IH607_03390 [Firmicutes bacterium]|nr:hypothetical protein [Bacillota bacterium]